MSTRGFAFKNIILQNQLTQNNNPLLAKILHPVIQPREIRELPEEYHLTPILVVLADSEQASDEETYLEKILNAVDKQPQRDYTVLRLTEADRYRFNELCAEITNRTVLCFGFHASAFSLQADLPHYIPVRLQNHRLMTCDLPSKIQKSPDLRRKLWQQLQRLFPKEPTT